MTFNISNPLPRSSITMRTMLGGWLALITSGVKRRRRRSRGMVVFLILQLALILLFTNFDHEKWGPLADLLSGWIKLFWTSTITPLWQNFQLSDFSVRHLSLFRALELRVQNHPLDILRTAWLWWLHHFIGKSSFCSWRNDSEKSCHLDIPSKF